MRGKSYPLLSIFLVLIVSFSIIGSSAPLAPGVKRALKEVKVAKIKREGETSKIWQLRRKPQFADILMINLDEEKFSSSQLEVLTNWVRKGNTVWIDPYNVDLCRLFDARSEQIEEKSMKVRSGSPHPVLTDVERVKISPAARIIDGYAVPLLKRENDVVAGLKYFGGGLVLMVPLPEYIDKDVLDGRRFLANLKQYGSGYPVPPSVTNGTVPPVSSEERDRVVLENQEVWTGQLRTWTFSFRTDYGSFNFDRKGVAWIKVAEERDIMRLKAGDRLIGRLLNERIRIVTSTGEERIIRKDRLQRILLKDYS